MLHIGWPQGIYLAILALSLLMAAHRHGTIRPAKRERFSDSLLGFAVALALLAWGGFFTAAP